MDQITDIIFVREPDQMDAALTNRNGIFGPLPKPLFVVAEWQGYGAYQGFPCAGHIPAYAHSVGQGMQLIEAFSRNAKDVRIIVMPANLDDTFMMALQDRVPGARLVLPNRLRATHG